MLKMNTSRNWLSFPSKIRYFQAYLKSSVPGPSNKAELDQTAVFYLHKTSLVSFC